MTYYRYWSAWKLIWSRFVALLLSRRLMSGF